MYLTIVETKNEFLIIDTHSNTIIGNAKSRKDATFKALVLLKINTFKK